MGRIAMSDSWTLRIRSLGKDRLIRMQLHVRKKETNKRVEKNSRGVRWQLARVRKSGLIREYRRGARSECSAWAVADSECALATRVSLLFDLSSRSLISTTTTNPRFHRQRTINMEEDQEQVDYEQDDDDLPPDNHILQYPTTDADDAVSLGGDDDDIEYSAVPQHTAGQSAPPSRTFSRNDSRGDREPSTDNRTPLMSPVSARSRSQTQLKHALPPKPIVASPSFPTEPSTTAASPMSMARRQKERRDSNVAENQALPAGWEARHSKRGETYYYDTTTKESQWTRPTASSRAKPSESSPVRGRGIPPDQRLVKGDSWVAALDGKDAVPRDVDSSLGKPSAEDFSYDDRHYRPGDAARTSHPDPSHRQVTAYATNDGGVARQLYPDNFAPHRGRRGPTPPREANGRGVADDDPFRAADYSYRNRHPQTGSSSVYNAPRPESPPHHQSIIYEREKYHRSDDDAPHSRHRSYSPVQNPGWSSAPSTLSQINPTFLHQLSPPSVNAPLEAEDLASPECVRLEKPRESSRRARWSLLAPPRSLILVLSSASLVDFKRRFTVSPSAVVDFILHLPVNPR